MEVTRNQHIKQYCLVEFDQTTFIKLLKINHIHSTEDMGEGDTLSGAFARIGSRSDAEERVSPSPAALLLAAPL